jgi:hypothetical protein
MAFFVSALLVGGMSTFLNVGLDVGVPRTAERCCFHMRPHTNISPFLFGSIYISRLALTIPSD